MKWFEDKTTDSGQGITRSFCTNCGSTLFLTSPALPQNIIVSSGTIDGIDGLFVPNRELYCNGKMPWLPELEGSTTFPANKL